MCYLILFLCYYFSSRWWRINYLSGFFTDINFLTVASKSLEEIIVEEEEKYIQEFSNLELRNIKYQYKNQSSTVMEISHFQVEKKDKIAIIEESGQGKTTLLNILTKDIALNQGEYLINGKSTSKK